MEDKLIYNEQEAIEAIKSNYPTSGYYMLREALDMAVSALEKQIPKMVTHESTVYRCLTCPICKNVVDEFTTFNNKKVRVTYEYCRFCGQALKWED